MIKLESKSVSVMLSLTAFGLVIGSIVSFFKLPVFLDTIGIMLVTLILGWRYGLVSALITSLISFFLVSPYVPFYIGTMIGLVWFTDYANKKGMFKTFPKTILAGVIHGLIGAVLSIPVTYYLFDGFTATGNDAIVAFFNTRGVSLLVSVIVSLGSFAILDRVLTAIFCSTVLKAIPKKFLERLNSDEK